MPIGEKGQLNLSTTVPKQLLEQAERGHHLQYLIPDEDPEAGTELSGSSSASGSSTAWAKLATILVRLQTILGKADGKTTVRVVIHELGGADWDDPSSHVSRSPDVEGARPRGRYGRQC